MAEFKFLINKDLPHERAVEADDMRIRDEFVDFDTNEPAAIVYRIKKSLVQTVELVEE